MKYLTYDDIGDFYQEKTGKLARIRPMEVVYKWATQQPEIEVADKETGRLRWKKEKNCGS